MITPETAAACARRELSRVNLDYEPGAAKARDEGRAGQPLFVKRVDLPDADYYLVPWEVDDRIEIVLQISASGGAMSSMAVLKPPVSRLLMSPRQSVEAVREAMQVSITGDPEVIWEPSRESATPLQPLYRVPVSGGYVFVLSDGRVLRGLTPFGRGG